MILENFFYDILTFLCLIVAMINKGYFTLYAVINFYFFYGIAALMKCGVIIICIILIPIIPVLILFAIRFWNGE